MSNTQEQLSISRMTELIVDFAEKRGWKNEDPNLLLTSLYIELAEMAEHYQWKNKFPEFSADKKREIGFEFVDILFYLLRIADQSGIDINACFLEKLPKLEKKFPLDVAKDPKAILKVKEEYRRTGKNKLYE